MESLKKNFEFKRVYSRGKSYATRNLVIYKNPNNLKQNRVGFSISKKIGKAVVRNRLKRRLKEIIRLKDNVEQGYDLIIIARKPVVALDYGELEKETAKLFKKAGISKEQA